MSETYGLDVDYRIQAYGIESMGYVAGALTAGIPEGDNATAGDDDRMLSTAVNLSSDNNLLSQEALTTIKQQLTRKIAASDVNNHSSSVTTVEIPNVAPGTTWASLPTNYAEQFGVTNMNAISGIGVYTTTVTLPDDWSQETDGAYLAFSYCENDMLAGITVNGEAITDLNALRDYTDLGHLLKAGENEITIQIDTTLVNRGQYEGGQTKTKNSQRVDDGLMSVELIPYTDTVIQ